MICLEKNAILSNMLDIYGGDKRMIRKIILFICVCISLISASPALAAGQLTLEDAERYLAPIYKEFESSNSSKVQIDLELVTPFANVNAQIDVAGLYAKSKVYKLDYKLELLMLGKSKKDYKLQQYMEQKGNDLHVYTELDNKWTKQVLPNMKIKANSNKNQQENESLKLAKSLELIKSVELLKYTPEEVEVKVVINSAKLYDVVEPIILADKTSFKDPKNKTEFLKIYREIMNMAGDLTYTEHIERKNKTIKTELDLTSFTKNIVNGLVSKYDKKMKDKDRADLAKFLDASRLTMKAEVIMLDKKEKIEVPVTVKETAKELPKKMPITKNSASTQEQVHKKEMSKPAQVKVDAKTDVAVPQNPKTQSESVKK